MWKISIICVFVPFFFTMLCSAVTAILLLVSENQMGFPLLPPGPLSLFNLSFICPVMTQKIWGCEKSESK